MHCTLNKIREMGHDNERRTESCMGEQTSLAFDLTFGDVWLHKLVQAY